MMSTSTSDVKRLSQPLAPDTDVKMEEDQLIY